MKYFREWRAADRVAYAAERRVVAATMRFINGGPGPTEGEIAESHRLRAIADDLFGNVMREMSEISNSLRW